MSTIKIGSLQTEIDLSLLNEDSFDVDFDGNVMIQVTRVCDDFYRVTNAVNGWGENCFDEYKNEKVNVED